VSGEKLKKMNNIIAIGILSIIFEIKKLNSVLLVDI